MKKIKSTVESKTIYTDHENDGDTAVTLHGGGNVDEVSDEDIKILEGNKVYQTHVKNGHISEVENEPETVTVTDPNEVEDDDDLTDDGESDNDGKPKKRGRPSK